MTQTTSDRAALIASVAASPDEDTPRLVFADWLDDNPLPEMECGECKGRGSVKSAFVPRSTLRCMICAGRKTVPDDLHERWAELIRLQIELARSQETSYVNSFLHDRIGALLPALRARLMPPCPNQKCVSGTVGRQSGIGGHTMGSPCGVCGDSVTPGVCPGPLVRGFPVCEVPLAAIGREVLESTIDLDGWENVFQPSAWARKAKWERGCWLVPSDLKPRMVGQSPVDDVGTRGESYFRSWDGSGREHSEHNLPPVIFDRMEGKVYPGEPHLKFYPTEPAAMSALATAVNGLIPRPREEVTER